LIIDLTQFTRSHPKFSRSSLIDKSGVIAVYWQYGSFETVTKKENSPPLEAVENGSQ
jgi:hypothetical protein